MKTINISGFIVWHYGGMFHDKGRAERLIDEICTDYNVKLT